MSNCTIFEKQNSKLYSSVSEPYYGIAGPSYSGNFMVDWDMRVAVTMIEFYFSLAVVVSILVHEKNHMI